MISTIELTYILGAKCAEGVVIVADNRVNYNTGEVRYENKTYCNLSQAVWASSGTREDFGWFRDRINPKLIGGMNKFDLMRTTSELLIEGRMKREIDDMELLLGIRARPERKSQLFYFNAGGGSQEIVEEKVIGSAEPLGRFFVKEYFRKDLPMPKAAVLGVFIIKLIEKQRLDNTVGFGNKPPTIWWVPDLPDDYQSDSELPKGVMQAFVVRQEEGAGLGVFMEPIDNLVDAWIEHNKSFFGDSFQGLE